MCADYLQATKTIKKGEIMNENKYLFVSYARADSDKVLTILKDLNDNGINIWYDKDIAIGTEWPDYIEKKIIDCSCFMVFISKESVNSSNVRNEINLALTLKKDTIVVYLEETELKHGLALQIGSKQSFLLYKHSSYKSMLETLISSELLQQCKEKSGQEISVSSGFTPSAKSIIIEALDLFQDALLMLKGNACPQVLSNILAQAEKLKLAINSEIPSKRSQYLVHLGKIDLFLNALKIQFSFYPFPNTLTYQLMFIDTYITQIIPEIELMRQI